MDYNQAALQMHEEHHGKGFEGLYKRYFGK